MNINIEATSVFEKNYEAYNDPTISTIINQGGARSSKTYSILQLLIIECLRSKKSVTICRKSFPSLRRSAYKDFIDILRLSKIYNINYHSKTENTYTFKNGSTVDFLSLDESEKVRGSKRDILYINECNEIDYETFIQLKIRTSSKIFIDYNPSLYEHWSYDIQKEADSKVIKSTYLDNPFLGPIQVKYIEDLIKADPDYYKIYVLGERVSPKTLVYNHFQVYDNIPPQDEIIDICYGLDIGYNHNTALVECIFAKDNRLYFREIIYKNEITIEDLKKELIKMNLSRDKFFYVDSARPDVIFILKSIGLRAVLSNKAVKEGIDFIKSKQVFININSKNLLRESKLYSWKTNKEEHILDEVEKKDDDGMDAIRYAAFSHAKKLNTPKTPYFIK
jgi:phage terminase large subunit